MTTSKKLSRTVAALIIGAGIIFQIVPASAQSPFDAREAPQGSALEILIPKKDITSLSATLDGAPVYFYPVQRQPKFDEPISRAEFLELMFLNGQNGKFPEQAEKADGTEESAPDFPDVSPAHPYYQTIQKAAALNIISGYEDGLFRPYTTITRGQIAKILVNAFDPPTQQTAAPRFPDVPPNHTFYEHIDRAIKAQIFQGYPDGLMRPNRDINFSEAETVIKRVLPDEAVFTPLGERDYYRGFVGIHRLSDIKTKDLLFLLKRADAASITSTQQHTEHHPNQPPQERRTIHLNVTPRVFPTHSFSLAPSKTALFGKDDQDKTWAAIDSAKKDPSPEQLFEGPFIMPTEGEPTLGFGDKLYINGAYSGSHFGHDWANAEGTPVHASNSGKVTLSAWTPSYGNTVVIDHGQNIFTMYLHLSELKVAQGATVQKGDLIGLMGATGIATGSHLHFTHFVGDIIVDSQPWLDGEFSHSSSNSAETKIASTKDFKPGKTLQFSYPANWYTSEMDSGTQAESKIINIAPFPAPHVGIAGSLPEGLVVQVWPSSSTIMDTSMINPETRQNRDLKNGLWWQIYGIDTEEAVIFYIRKDWEITVAASHTTRRKLTTEDIEVIEQIALSLKIIDHT